MHDGIFKPESWAKLEKPERLKSLEPIETLTALGLKPGDSFADFGSGTGVFILPALDIVGRSGRVYAVERSEALIGRMLQHFDSQPEALVVFQQDLMDLEWKAELVQYALLCHVAHELPDLIRFFTLAGKAVVPGGKLCIIEWALKEQPQGPPMEKRISPESLNTILEITGWIPAEANTLGDDFYSLTVTKA